MSIAKYGILRHYPYPTRTEHVNIGVVVFREDGRVVVRMGSNLRKLKALDPTADIDTVHNQEESIPALLVKFGVQNQEDAIQFLQAMGPWRLDENLGAFEYGDEVGFEENIRWALAMSVDPTIKQPTRPLRQPTSRLFLDLKRTFDAYGWIGRDIHRHQIVTRYPIIEDEGIVAEFALQNGVLHVLETVDFRASSNYSAKRGEAQAKALVMNVATSIDMTTKSYAVIAGSDIEEAKPSLKLLERIASDVFVYESHDDMQKLFGDLSTALGQQMLSPPIG